MMLLQRMSVGIVVLLIFATCQAADDAPPQPGAASEQFAMSEQLYVRRIAPLLREKCVGCHGDNEPDREGSLDLSSQAGLLAGGDSGQPLIQTDAPDSSPLLRAVLREDSQWSAMPPKEAERLSTEQTLWLRQWIATGAAWPNEARQQEIEAENVDTWSAEDGVTVLTSGGLSDEWTNRKYDPEGLWAYQPVRKPDVDENIGGGVHSPIDRLIADHMPIDLQVAPRADRRTLIRRASFDLLGLPPTPEEVQAFVSDRQDDRSAFAELVEHLLSSPHYGERMAQHWLDVVRYADSSGFANDFERGNAWRYRDYVIRAFNDDKPYDQFVKEQIAGDEIDSDNPEMIVATGFLRMGPWELTGMEVAKVARQRFLDDVTNSVGETFLAHSLQCARCHDHKFDPVPTRDYYSIQAVFATTQLADRKATFLPDENLDGFEEREYLGLRQADYQRELDALDEVLLKNAEEWFAENGFAREAPSRKAWDAAVAELAERQENNNTPPARGVFNAARSQLMKQGLAEESFPPKLVGFTAQQFGLERVARKGIERLKWELERYEPFALAVYNGRTPQQKSVVAPVRIPRDRLQEGELETTCILSGGDPFSPTEAVSPGVLSAVISSAFNASEIKIPTEIEGRRLAFAQWVANPQNPLTTRAIVNRVWLWHFNQPIAGNPNNFGSTGKPPTHPELLDWLAVRLLESGWSLKALHREIMNSDAYCRSCEHPQPAELENRDPLGTSYAAFRPRRMSAEEMRDAMLRITGELNPTLGGIPNRPEINLEVALQPRQVMGTFAAAWTPNVLPSQRHRRSIYSLKLRGLSNPLLEVFNAPSPDFSCERRDASTVTPQVFSLFNGQNAHLRAVALAQRVVQGSDRDETAIQRCFELVLNRQPTAKELSMCLAHWHKVLESLPEHTEATEGLPLQVVRDAVEENTGERFVFQENLYSNANFVADLQPGDVDLRTRALADLCLVMFNANEFLYVY